MLLRQLHWVSVPERVNLKLCVLLYENLFIHHTRLNTQKTHSAQPGCMSCVHGKLPMYSLNARDHFNFSLLLQSELGWHVPLLPPAFRASGRDCVRPPVPTSWFLRPATHRYSLGDRAFPVAGAQAWNALPPSVTSAPSLSSFRRLLKTFLFQRQRHG